MTLQTATPTESRPAIIGSTGSATMGRYIGTCGKCKRVHVFNGRTVEARINGKWSCGWMTDGDEFIPFNHNSRANCGCGQSVIGVEMKRLQIRIVDHKCSAKCRNSKGHVCDCSCGGKNHGAGFEA